MTTGTASIVGVCVSGQVALSAGDTTQVKVYQNTGATRSLEAQTISNWIQIIRLDGVSTPPIYDTQDSNSTPDKTLVLVSAFPVTIDLEVF